MKYFIIFLIASFVFFGCDANNAGDDSGIDSGDGSPQDDGSGSNEDDNGIGSGGEDPQDDGSGSNEDDNGIGSGGEDPQDDGSGSNEDDNGIGSGGEDPQDDSGIGNGDGSPQDDNGGSNEDDNGIGSGDGSSQDDGGGNGISDGNHCTEADILLGITTYMGEPYITITDQAGLEAISSGLSDKYILCENITINTPFTHAINPDTDNTNNTFDGDEFTGTLDGNGKTISNLKIQAQGSDFVGLFGQIAANGKVRDLHISLAGGDTNDPSISGYGLVGALAGENYGTITNVGVTGGYIKGWEVDLNDPNSLDAFNTGGLVGRNYETIENSYATSKVEGQVQVGGLLGHNRGTIETSYATGAVEGGNYVGGLVGANEATIAQSYATGAVEGSDYVGGLVGYNTEEIAQSYATGTVTGAGSLTGGLVGYISGGRITASYFDAETTRQSRGPSPAIAYYTNPADGQVHRLASGAGYLINEDDHFPDWDFIDTWAWQGDGQWPLLQFQTMTVQ